MPTKYKDGWQQLISLCLVTKEELLPAVLDFLLTREEKESLAMRCLITQELLAKKKTQRQIAKDLNVSIAKITRGSNALKSIQSPILKYLRAKLIECDLPCENS